MQADLGDAVSLERAFEGAHIIYAMTDFWQSMSADVEAEQGKVISNIADGLPQLEHFVWASLPDGRALSAGKYSNIFHWQSKAAVAKCIRDSKPRLWGKTIEILFPNYFENCVTNSGVYLPRKVGLERSLIRVLPPIANIKVSKAMVPTYARSASTAKQICQMLRSPTLASWSSI